MLRFSTVVIVLSPHILCCISVPLVGDPSRVPRGDLSRTRTRTRPPVPRPRRGERSSGASCQSRFRFWSSSSWCASCTSFMFVLRMIHSVRLRPCWTVLTRAQTVTRGWRFRPRTGTLPHSLCGSDPGFFSQHFDLRLRGSHLFVM